MGGEAAGWGMNNQGFVRVSRVWRPGKSCPGKSCLASG